MKNDLVSREALKEALEVTQYNDIDDLTKTERLIDNAPTVCERYENFCGVLVHERPRGEWIYDYRTCKCSVCNFTTVIDTYNFCPNCGAQMTTIK